MKKLSVAAALALVVAGPALAGAKGAVVMEPVVEEPYVVAAPSSLPHAGVLIAAGVAAAVVLGGSDSSGGTSTTTTE